MKLTKEWLKDAATISSLYRGDDHYDEVAELQKEGNKFTAIVYGEMIYDVQIEENELDIDCFCTCDFDVGGICEHVVAVCLNILDGQFEEVIGTTKADLEETIPISAESRLKDDKNFYKNIFTNADQALKDAFLQQLFENNETLRQNFLAFQQNNKHDPTSVDISSLQKKLHAALLAIDFSEIEAVHDSTNAEEGNSLAIEERAIEKIEAVYRPYGEKALDFLANEQLIPAFMVYLGMFEASFGLPEPEWENDPLIDDFEAETMTICHHWQTNLMENLENTPPKDQQIKSCIQLIFDRWQLHHHTSSESTIYYDFKFFEPFLLTTLTASTATYLKDLLIDHQLINYQTANLALHCAQLLQQEDWWLEIAENFAGNDAKIAEKLMLHYGASEQIDEFYRVAHFAFDLFPDKLVGFLLKNVHPKIDRPFYITLLKHYTQNKQDIESFKELREFISPEEKALFMEENATNLAFYAKLLAAELRFSEILELAKANQNAWEFNDLIRPILQIYPRDIFDLQIRRTIEDLTLHTPNRVDYKRIGKNLSILHDLKGLGEQKALFIKQLKKQFRHRPELLEEVAAAGF